MEVLEVICDNCNLFNLIPIKKIKLHKEFRCDNDTHICNNLVLTCDNELLNQLN